MNKATLSGFELNTEKFCKTLTVVLLICVSFTQPVLAQDKEKMLRKSDLIGQKVETNS